MSAAVDDEIRAVQERIAHRRMDLSDAGVQLADNIRVRVASPRTLLIAAAGGFIAGFAALRMRDPQRRALADARHHARERRIREGRRRTDLLQGETPRGASPAAGRLGLVGMLAGWGLTLARARHGGSSPMMLAQMLLSRFRR